MKISLHFSSKLFSVGHDALFEELELGLALIPLDLAQHLSNALPVGGGLEAALAQQDRIILKTTFSFANALHLDEICSISLLKSLFETETFVYFQLGTYHLSLLFSFQALFKAIRY